MDLFTLSAKMTLDTKEFEKQAQNAEGRGKKIGDNLKSGISAGTIAAGQILARWASQATSTLKGVFTDAMGGYADRQQLVGGVETLFKESSDKVTKYAKTAYKNQGISANQYMETVTSFAASLVSSLGGDTVTASELANTAITDMSDNANKMGTDFASIQNAYQGFAKQNFTINCPLSAV